MVNLEQLGIALRSVARALLQRIDDQLDKLSKQEIQDMNSTAQELLNKSKELFVASVIEIGEEAKSSIERLSEAEDQMTNAMRTIESVQKVIDISTKLVGVAGNVLSLDTGAVVSGVEEVLGKL